MSSYSWSYASTSRATCRGQCKAQIPKGALRLGSEDQGAKGFSVKSYRCLPCVTKKIFDTIEAKLGSVGSVPGFHELDERECSAIRVAVSAAGETKAVKPKPRNKPTSSTPATVQGDPTLRAPLAPTTPAPIGGGANIPSTATSGSGSSGGSTQVGLTSTSPTLFESDVGVTPSPEASAMPRNGPRSHGLNAALMPFQRQGVAQGIAWGGRLLLCDESAPPSHPA